MSDQIQQQQSPAENAIDPLILQAALQRLKSEQNLVLAALAGGVAALLGACIWAAVTVTTNYQIGWMAVGVGFLVGYAVRSFGKGIDKSFGNRRRRLVAGRVCRRQLADNRRNNLKPTEHPNREYPRKARP